MKYPKKIIVVIMVLLTLQLYIPGITVADQAILYAKAETDGHAPESQVVLEKDLPEKEGWFSKYKWWVIGGLVLIAGGAAAAGGGGGGSDDGGSSPASTPQDDPGGVTVSW